MSVRLREKEKPTRCLSRTSPLKEVHWDGLSGNPSLKVPSGSGGAEFFFFFFNPAIKLKLS